MLENTGVFRHSLSLCMGFLLLQAELRNLKNTVWKTPFRTLRRNGKTFERFCSSRFAFGF